VSMLALDQFVLWSMRRCPTKNAKDYVEAVKKAGPLEDENGRHRFQAGRPDHHRGPGEADRHQVHLRAVQGRRRRRGATGGKHIDSSVNNPIEAVAQWRAGKLRPLCVFDDERMPYKTKGDRYHVPGTTSPPASNPGGYGLVMLRGIFMAGGVKDEERDFYVELLKKVRATPDWKEFMEKGAFNQNRPGPATPTRTGWRRKSSAT